MQIENAPTLAIRHPDSGAGGQSVVARGVWQVHALSRHGTLKDIARTLAAFKDNPALEWDLTQIASIDHIGAQMFWNAWDKRRPARLKLDPRQEDLFGRIEQAGSHELPRAGAGHLQWVVVLGAGILSFFEHLHGFVRLIGQLVQDIGRLVRRPRTPPGSKSRPTSFTRASRRSASRRWSAS